MTCEVPTAVSEYEELEELEAFRLRTHGSDELPLTDGFYVACELDNTAGRLLGDRKFAIDGIEVVSPSGEEVVAESPNVLYWARTYMDTGAEDGVQVMEEAPDLVNRHIQRNFAPEGAVETVFLFSEEPLVEIGEVYVIQEVTGGGVDQMTPLATETSTNDGSGSGTTTPAGGLCEGAQLLRDWWDIDAPSPEQFPSIEQGLNMIAESNPALAEDVDIVGAVFGFGDPSQEFDLMASGEAQRRIDSVVAEECGEPIWGSAKRPRG